MKVARILWVGLMIASLAAAGCSGKDKDKGGGKDEKDDKDHAAHGNGPNDGVVFDLGKEHAELTVDHPKKEITILFLKEGKGKKEKDWPALPVSCKELTLTTKETKTKKDGKVVPPMTIKLLPKDEKDGKASKFVGTDPGLENVADFEGTVAGEVDGKPAQGKFEEK